MIIGNRLFPVNSERHKIYNPSPSALRMLNKIHNREAVSSGFYHWQNSFAWFPCLLLIITITETIIKSYFGRKLVNISLQFIVQLEGKIEWALRQVPGNQNQSRDQWGTLCTCWIPMASSVCFPIQPRTPARVWHCLQCDGLFCISHLPGKCPDLCMDQSDRGNCSVEVPFSQWPWLMSSWFKKVSNWYT